jgi:leucyl-tRNA synthetase
MVNSSDELDIIQVLREDYADAEFINEENGKYVGREIKNVEIQIQCGNAR